ncbi:hypothetical protein DQP55_21640 [Mycolicibacterium sp. GF69]|uniref:hypothetical protein n=1 Tax=Mycolicibacterium sp. GF69 TaxID=2267251 RepID=UPI000DCC58E0|nr:hypothetical protein [Mycolicibacterium sp. GF69]RAV07445.1 hypothetical protein DQP55_21640 [Mycolicibacterium sp. GF69]
MQDAVTVIINRASVAMGDDVDSHVEFWVYPRSATVDDLLVEISSRYLPGVAGPAGWCLYIDSDDSHARRVLGLIYTRDDLGIDDHMCRLIRGRRTLGELARHSELEVYASYLTGDSSRAFTLGEVTQTAHFTGCRPTRLESEAEAQAKRAWWVVKELDREAAAVRAARRNWIRDNVILSSVWPTGADVFLARNFHFLTSLLCNASMGIAAELLETETPSVEGLGTAALSDDRARMTTLVMVLAGFEWGLQSDSWRFGERDYCRRYLEFLAECGYRLSPIEEVMAGHVTVDDFLARQSAVRERVARIGRLREEQNAVRMRHYRGETTHDQYEAAVQPINAELTALGQHPGPPLGCCR